MIVVSAFPPEVLPFSALKGADGAWAAAAPARTLGVGLVAAATSMGRLLAKERPAGVVLVGSCGAYPREPAVAVAPPPNSSDVPPTELLGKVAVAERFFLLDGGVAEGRSAFPGTMNTDLEADPRLVALFKNAGCVSGVVGTTLGITTDDAWAHILMRGGAAFENMEAFAVAHACAEARVPFAAVLGITNIVGSEGRAGWLARHVEAAEDVARIVARVLRTTTTQRSPA